MSFYRKITRERTLCALNNFQTTDDGLKESISRFSTKPREAKFFGTLKIQDDYYSYNGVNDKQKSGNSLSDGDYSDSDDRSYSMRIADLRYSEDEKCGLQEKQSSSAISKMWKNKILSKLFPKRKKSCDSFISDAKSSYGTDMSYSDTRSVSNKERYERMEDDGQDLLCSRSRDREPIIVRHSK